MDLLRIQWFTGLVVPALLVVLTAAWKLFARPGNRKRDNWMLGMDLLVGALGVQVTFLAGYAVAEPSTRNLTGHIHTGWYLLGATLIAALPGAGLFIRGRCWEECYYQQIRFDEHSQPQLVPRPGRPPYMTVYEPTPFGVRIPNLIGVIALSAVFYGNVYGPFVR